MIIYNYPNNLYNLWNIYQLKTKQIELPIITLNQFHRKPTQTKPKTITSITFQNSVYKSPYNQKQAKINTKQIN